MCDDIFDETAEDQTLAEQSWRNTITQMNKAGYREGLDAGKEEVLQEGFNQTFSASSQLLYKIAELRGKINGRLSYNLIKGGRLDKNQETGLQYLLQDVVSLESELLQASRVRLEDWLADSVTKSQGQTDRVSDETSVKPNNGCVCSSNENKCNKLSEVTDISNETLETESSSKGQSENGASSSVKTASGDASNIGGNLKIGNDLLDAGFVTAKLTSFTEQFNSILT